MTLNFPLITFLLVCPTSGGITVVCGACGWHSPSLELDTDTNEDDDDDEEDDDVELESQ